MEQTRITAAQRQRMLNVNYFCRPVASRENVTVEGGVASRGLLLTLASPRMWWLAGAVRCAIHAWTMTPERLTSMLGIGPPQSQCPRQAI